MNIDCKKLEEIIGYHIEGVEGVYNDSMSDIGVINGCRIQLTVYSKDDDREKSRVVLTDECITS